MDFRKPRLSNGAAIQSGEVNQKGGRGTESAVSRVNNLKCIVLIHAFLSWRLERWTPVTYIVELDNSETSLPDIGCKYMQGRYPKV